MTRKILAFGLISMVVMLGNVFPLAKVSAGKLELYMGSTDGTSSMYAGSVALVSVINRNVPNAHVTLVESRGTYDNINRTRGGEFQLSSPSAYSALIESYYGLGRYQGKPDTSIRVLSIISPGAVFYLVRKDSGITDVRGLHKKKFYPGPTGHLHAVATEKVFSAVGIYPSYFVGGFADAVTATQDNRIVGFAKYGAGLQLDASMLQVSAVIPCRLLTWTPEMVDIVLKLFPGVVRLTVPKGIIKAMPGEGPITSYGLLTTTWTTKNLPEDIAYNIVKAINKHWASDIVPSYAPCKDVDPLKDTIKLLSDPEQPVPLHAGAVKYFREKGLEVPNKLIPPEK